MLDELKKNRLDTPGADPRTPVIIQSFSPASLQKMRRMGTTLPLVLLISNLDAARHQWLSDEALRKARTFADGIGPAKSLLVADPTLAARPRALGFSSPLTPSARPARRPGRRWRRRWRRSFTTSVWMRCSRTIPIAFRSEIDRDAELQRPRL